jgi:hypothetical protein
MSAKVLHSPSSSSATEPSLTKAFGLLLATQFCFGLAFSSFFLLPKFVPHKRPVLT